jgi:hypothetical protein
MTASLIVAGFETYDNSVARPVQLSGLGWIPGDPLPDQATIEQTYLDGEAVTGKRTRNRNMRIPVWVSGISALDLAANVNALWQAVTADTFTVQWTPNGGLPVIYDCYHATVTKPNNTYLADQFVAAVMIECQALPFGRSPDPQTVAVQSTLQIDSFDTAPTGATLNTTTKYEGTGSGQFTSWGYISGGINPGSTSDTMSRTFTAKDISAYSSVGLRIRADEAATFNIVTLTLTSASGSTKFTGVLSVAANQWGVIYLPLTGGTITAGSGVTLSAVTAWSLVLFARNQNLTGHVVLVDDLRAAGTAATVIGPTSHGAVLAVPVSVGAARTPANLALTPASGTLTAFVLHSPPIDQDPNVAILSALSNSLTDQTITIAALNSRFRGTYAAVLGVDTVGSGSITATITVTQKANGTTVGVAKTITKTYTAGARVIPAGEVTLPLYDVPDDNTTTSYTVRVQVTGAERYSEVMLLDTSGQTVLTDSNLAAGAAAVYIDEPSPLQSGSSVFATASDRTAAFGVLGNCFTSGGPILLEPGANKFLAWVSTNTPVVTATYYPRWPFERAA